MICLHVIITTTTKILIIIIIITTTMSDPDALVGSGKPCHTHDA
jgi:hypothetical protein